MGLIIESMIYNQTESDNEVIDQVFSIYMCKLYRVNLYIFSIWSVYYSLVISNASPHSLAV